jgi:hypothetical protein
VVVPLLQQVLVIIVAMQVTMDVLGSHIHGASYPPLDKFSSTIRYSHGVIECWDTYTKSWESVHALQVLELGCMHPIIGVDIWSYHMHMDSLVSWGEGLYSVHGLVVQPYFIVEA